jgi:hypothetical protein
MRQALQNIATSHAAVFCKILKFKRRRTSCKKEDRNRQLTTGRNEENIAHVETTIKEEYSQLTCRDNEKESEIRVSNVSSILHSQLHMGKVNRYLRT